MKQQIIYKKNWNAGIDVIYSEGKEIKLTLSEEDFRRNLIAAAIRNLNHKELRWSVKEATIKATVADAVEKAFKEVSSDAKRDTWKKLV